MGVCAPFTYAINQIPVIATIGKSTDKRIVTQRWLVIPFETSVLYQSL